jgi:parallel beta-helix repeat protein
MTTVLLTIPVTQNDIIYVDDDGSADYTRIQDAIDNASDGDTIYVYSGTYFEDVKINTSIVLQGEDKESTIIHGGGFGSGDAVVYISADNVEITGFSIRNSCPYWPGSGIGLYRNEQCIVIDNIVSDCFLGINAFITSDATISMNTVSDSEIGIHVQASKRNTITRNTMQDNHCGMYLNGAYFNKIKENNFINNDRHFDFYGVILNTIDSNYWDRLVNIGPKLAYF